MRPPLAQLLLLSVGALASCDATSERPLPAPKETPTQRFEFVDVAGSSGIDVRQLGGAEHVPTLIDGLGCGGGWFDYELAANYCFARHGWHV